MTGFSQSDEVIWLRMVEAALVGRGDRNAYGAMSYADDVLAGLACRRAGFRHPSTADIAKQIDTAQTHVNTWNANVLVGDKVRLKDGGVTTTMGPAYVKIQDGDAFRYGCATAVVNLADIAAGRGVELGALQTLPRSENP